LEINAQFNRGLELKNANPIAFAHVFTCLVHKSQIMNAIFRSSGVLLALSLIAGHMSAQTSVRIDPAPARLGRLGSLIRPYQQRTIPPVNLSNSSRIESLIRAGNLYLTAQDVIALALENSIDIEVQRYGPLLAREVLRRAESGGLLRNVGQGVATGPTSVSLTGVSVNGNGAPAGSNGVNAGGGVLTQLGPNISSFDPTLSSFVNFQHSTSPQSNTVLTGTTALIQDNRSYQAQYAQNWPFGLSAQLTYQSSHSKVNSTFFSINPSTNGSLDLTLTQNLLNGFGAAVNGRNIRVQKNNLKVTDLQFKQQVITTVAAALNLYWDLVSFDQDLRARQQEVSTADQLLKNNQQQVTIGTLAEIEVTRAQAQLYAARQDLVISQTNLLQQETVLKNAISRTGVATSVLADVHVVPLDKIEIPAKDDVAPVEELVAQALKNRVEIAEADINLESNKLNLVGIRNSLKPTLQAFAELTNNGLSGPLTPVGASQPGVPAGYLAGGYGNLLAEIFRRNYPSYSAGLSLNIVLRNRASQSDYVTSVIEMRQNELNKQKQINQVRVDVQNAIIGLQQARARYDAAVQGLSLSQQTLDADQKKYELGAGTPYQVVQDQRDLASAQSSQEQALANYSHARISLEQALGTTLEAHNISLEEAASGRVRAAPAALPQSGGRP
jgi:outer membrane protein